MLFLGVNPPRTVTYCPGCEVEWNGSHLPDCWRCGQPGQPGSVHQALNYHEHLDHNPQV